MLSWSCRRFRARFVPGTTHPHRGACRDCEAFAAALETAAGVRLPLPAGLRKGLPEIARPAAGAVLPFPVPRLEMPGALAGRLSAMARPGRPAPPEWVVNPRYAVAASALLALILGPFFVTAAERSHDALGAVREEVSPLLRRTGEEGREELGRLRAGASEALEALDEARRRLSAFVPEQLTDPGPEDEPAGPSRRP